MTRDTMRFHVPSIGLFCRLNMHRWQTMTIGRLGFVREQRCSRGCGATRMQKGRFAW